MKYLLLLFSVATLNFSTFCQDTSIGGTASDLGEGCYQITAPLNTQNGQVWFEEQLDLSEDFDINLIMNFGNNDGGADGMVFVLQNNGLDAAGTGGGGVGYLGLLNSIGIEFDTWVNGDVGDITADHIGISSNGLNTHNLAGPIQADIGSTDIEDGDDHEVRIKWTAETNLLEVFFDCEFRVSSNTDIVNTSFGGDPIVYWGVVGSTGGANNLQTFCLNSGSGIPVSFVTCPGGSVDLELADLDAGEPVLWSPDSYLDDATAPIPTSMPEEDVLYEVAYTHVCGYEVTSLVDVSLIPLDVTDEVTPSFGCDDNVVLIEAESNYEDIEITWTTTNGNITVENGLNVVVDQIGQYTVEVSFNDVCFDEYTFDIVTDLDGISVDIAEPFELDCYNSEITLDATVGTSGVDIAWTTPDGNFISGTNGLSPTVDQPGTYVLNVDLDDSCFGEGTIEVIENNDGLVLTLESLGSINCNDDEAEINVSSNVSPTNYSWSTGNGSIVSGNNSNSLTVDLEGDYGLMATAGDCEATLDASVISDLEPILVTFDSIGQLTCTSDLAQVQATAEGNYTVTWATANGNIVSDPAELNLQADETGTYFMQIIDSDNGCAAVYDLMITENFELNLTVPEEVFLTCEFPEVAFSALVDGDPNDYVFTWTYLGQETQGVGQNIFTADAEGEVELTIEFGECSAEANTQVSEAADYSIDLSSITAPNVFTPNGDELNSEFRPVLATDLTFDVLPFLVDYKMEIYNRWGTIIYETTDSGWDGNIDGDEMETGAYYYIITFRSICGDDSEGVLNGSVVLLK